MSWNPTLNSNRIPASGTSGLGEKELALVAQFVLETNQAGLEDYCTCKERGCAQWPRQVAQFRSASSDRRYTVTLLIDLNSCTLSITIAGVKCRSDRRPMRRGALRGKKAEGSIKRALCVWLQRGTWGMAADHSLSFHSKLICSPLSVIRRGSSVFGLFEFYLPTPMIGRQRQRLTRTTSHSQPFEPKQPGGFLMTMSITSEATSSSP